MLKISQKNVILAIHGFTGEAFDFRPLYEHPDLDVNWRFVDLPGHHRFPKDSISMEQEWILFQNRIHSILENAKKNGQKIFALGYSMGARLLLRAQLLNKWDMDQMILIGATAGLQSDSGRLERFRHDQTWAKILTDQGIEDFVDQWMKQPIIATQDAPDLDERINSKLQLNPNALAESLLFFSNGILQPVWSELSSLQLPLTLIAGEKDKKFLELHQKMSEFLPDSRTLAIPNAGHAPHLENTDAFVQRLHDILFS